MSANVSNVYLELISLYSDLRTAADTLNRKTHLTLEGKRAEWDKTREARTTRLERLETHIEALTESMDAYVHDSLHEVTDTSRIPVGSRVTAELEASRILSRGPLNLDAAKGFVQRAFNEPDAYGYIIAANEAMERGVLTVAMLDAFITELSPAYIDVLKKQVLLTTAINNVLKPWVRECAGLIDNYQMPDNQPEKTIVELNEVVGKGGLVVPGAKSL